MPPYDHENQNPLSHYSLDETEPGRLPNHHLDNAITSLCLALQWAKDGRTADNILCALKRTCEAKFGQGPL